MTLRARAKTACEIARIDPGKLNEAIHDGHYNCAPETRPGSARIFDVDQIVSLKIFGILLSTKMSIERAGQIACQAYDKFAEVDNISKVFYVNRNNGAWHLIARSVGDNASLPAVAMFFDIPYLRDLVTKHLEYERDNQILGED